jgi:peptidoglycan L-alanyl-D-glutamate endopeptidase CwlK
MDAPSEEKLAQVHPVLATKVRAANDALIASTGNGLRVAQGLRTYAEQEALYEQGRSEPGSIVTNAPGGYSNHNFGMAVDCYPFTAGDAGALDWNGSDPEFLAMVAALKAQGLVWGGDWKSITDKPHFQLAGVPVSPTPADRKAFAAGGLSNVWEQYKFS